MKPFVTSVIAITICEGVGLIGALFTAPAIISGWYGNLVKPELSPPNWIFGPVWTILYLLMGVALFLVWQRNWKVSHQIAFTKKAWNKYSSKFWSGSWQKANIILVFAVQLLLNAAWSWFFFGLHNSGLAFFDLLALWVAIIYVIVNFYRVSKSAAWILLPYFLWVSFAGYLNLAIYLLN